MRRVERERGAVFVSELPARLELVNEHASLSAHVIVYQTRDALPEPTVPSTAGQKLVIPPQDSARLDTYGTVTVLWDTDPALPKQPTSNLFAGLYPRAL